MGWPGGRIPRLYAAASLKRPARRDVIRHAEMYSAALCRGLIEALVITRPCRRRRRRRIPRLYAAASLKPVTVVDNDGWENAYSAALCRGLIEARRPDVQRIAPTLVFRGSMPRPH